MPELLVTTYEAYKSLHVLAAVIWVGGDFMIQVFALRALAAKDPERVAVFAADVAWIGSRVLVPTSFLLLVFGMAAAQQANFDFGQLWITLGLAVFLISFVTGAAFLGPESGRISKLVGLRGAADPEVQRRIARVLWISRIELVLLLLIIVDMVIKPN